MRICVFGASGPVGRATVRSALSAGHDVTAVTRRPLDFGQQDPRLRVVSADVTDPGQVTESLDSAGAVISTFGVNPNRRPISTYSRGIATVLQGMRQRDVRRIVAVSSKNLTTAGTRGEPLLYRSVLGPLLQSANRTLYADMRRMEQLLADSDRDWTVLRPAGLFAAERVSDYRLVDHAPGVFTSTVDLADALVDGAVAERPRVREVLEVLTVSGTPTILAMIAGQAALHRR